MFLYARQLRNCSIFRRLQKISFPHVCHMKKGLFILQVFRFMYSKISQYSRRMTFQDNSRRAISMKRHLIVVQQRVHQHSYRYTARCANTVSRNFTFTFVFALISYLGLVQNDSNQEIILFLWGLAQIHNYKSVRIVYSL